MKFFLWADHCAAVFNVPPEYFLAHWDNDPQRSLGSVFVAFDKEANTIASTVRVFHRRVWIDGEGLLFGGIGEVSTKSQYRRQGLASKLLQMALGYMEAAGMEVSILITSPKSMHFYESLGYQSAALNYWLVRAVAPTALPGALCTVSLVEVDDLTPSQREAITALYNDYSLKFDCPVVRNEEYWRRWVFGREFRLVSLFLMTAADAVSIRGYMTLKLKKDGVCHFQEFAVGSSDDAKAITESAIPQALHLLGATSPVDVQFPSPLGDFFSATHKRDVVINEAFMARPIGPNITSAAQRLFAPSGGARVFWDTDDF
jgi:GNAT superfamily N-acetyltransferase